MVTAFEEASPNEARAKWFLTYLVMRAAPFALSGNSPQ